MRVGKFDIRLTYPPKPDALLLLIDSRKSAFMWRVCEGLNVEGYNLKKRVIYLRVKYLAYLVKFSRQSGRMSSMLCARLASQRIGVVLASENHDAVVPTKTRRIGKGSGGNERRTLFDEISQVLPCVQILSVQHGQELRRFPQNTAKRNVTLFCWGAWSAQAFPSFGRNERHYVPVGPLIDGLYRQIRPAEIRKDVEICLVSTVKGKSWWGNETNERSRGYAKLVEYLAQFAIERGTEINVALTIDRDQFGPDDAKSERKWFIDRLGSHVRFTEPSLISGDPSVLFDGRSEPSYVRERYATYYLCDKSHVTVGMASSVLWESFGRGNKLLAVNCTDNAVFDFPIDGVWSLRQPTYQEFSHRLKEILEMTQLAWDAASLEARRFLIHSDSRCFPDEKIRQLLLETINCWNS